MPRKMPQDSWLKRLKPIPSHENEIIRVMQKNQAWNEFFAPGGGADKFVANRRRRLEKKAQRIEWLKRNLV